MKDPKVRRVREVVICHSATVASVLADVAAKREVQDTATGAISQEPSDWLSVLADVLGECSEAAGRAGAPGVGMLADRAREQAAGDLRVGLVNLMAAAAAAVQDIDKRWPGALAAIGQVPPHLVQPVKKV